MRAHHHTYRVRLRTSNRSDNYGPYQYPKYRNALMLVNVLTAKQIPVSGDGPSIGNRLYVDHHCHGIELILKQGAIGEAINIGCNHEQQNKHIN